MQTKAYRIKLDKNIKQAIMAGEGYEDLKTLLQFYDQQRNIVQRRINKLENQMDKFLEHGGNIEMSEDGLQAKITVRGNNRETFSYTVEYNEDGSIEAYRAQVGKNNELTLAMHRILFAITILPYYKDHIEVINKHVKDINNSSAINSMCDISKQVCGDLNARILSIGGVPIDEISDAVDPFDIFEEDYE